MRVLLLRTNPHLIRPQPQTSCSGVGCSNLPNKFAFASVRAWK